MRSGRPGILCATDLLPRSEAAVDRAALMADALDADLTLLHVASSSESERGLEQTLRNAHSRLRSRARFPLWRFGRMPSTVIRTGNPTRAVAAEIAEGTGADLLVLGPHRRRLLQDALEGTIAARALAKRVCPVLMVQSRAAVQYQRVLLALDLSPASGNAVRVAEQLALTANTTAQVVHADDPLYTGMLSYADVTHEHVAAYSRTWRMQKMRDIRDLLARESGDAGRFGIHIESGHAVRGILNAVETFGPDLVVMGTRAGGRLHRAILGSVANSVVRKVACDVLVVPRPAMRAAHPG